MHTAVDHETSHRHRATKTTGQPGPHQSGGQVHHPRRRARQAGKRPGRSRLQSWSSTENLELPLTRPARPCICVHVPFLCNFFFYDIIIFMPIWHFSYL